MIKKVFFCFFSYFLLTTTALAIEPLTADDAFQFSATAKDNQTILASWKIAPTYYLYRNHFTFSAIKPANTVLGKPLYPSDTQTLKTMIGDKMVYANQVTIPIPLIQSNQHHVILQATYQGCSKAGYCYPPITKVASINLAGDYLQPEKALNIDIAPSTALQAPKKPSHQNPILFLLSFFGFGILLSLTPCVLPMIPILFSMIKGHDKSHTHAILITCAYVIGMSLMYALAGLLFGAIGQNIQILFQKPAVIIAFSAVFVLMALSEFGLFNLQLPEKWANKVNRISRHQKRGSIIGGFIMGCLSTLILSPCVTPPLVAALTFISHAGNAALGAAALFIMGVGMGVPLLLIGIAGPKVLPKSGNWMNAIKIITGILLLLVAAFMLQRLIPSKHDNTTTLDFQPVQTLTDVQHKLKKAASDQQIVMLDFYANWCISCKELDATTLKNPAIIKRLQHYTLLRANISNESAQNELLMHHFHIIGTPTILFFKNNAELPKTRIVGYTPAATFSKKLDIVDKIE